MNSVKIRRPGKRAVRRALVPLLVAAATAGVAAVPARASIPPPTGCGGSAYAPPFSVWGDTSVGNCGVFGSNGYRLGFSFWTNDTDTGTQVLMQAWSYQDNRWENVDFGTAGSGTIAWGDVDATPKVRFLSNGTGVGVHWSY